MIAKGILIFNCKLLSEYFTIRKNRIKKNRQRMKASQKNSGKKFLNKNSGNAIIPEKVVKLYFFRKFYLFSLFQFNLPPCKNSFTPSNIQQQPSSHFTDNQKQFSHLNYYFNSGLKRTNVSNSIDLNDELKEEEINLKRVKRELFFF
ncbi:unnamed protein product [Meloidogyne enterolobii]|uniref:Uncharacterized protein n=1 Tax=Meloidogyne enterolobii TaxID=390850 RepID=A0ACB1ADS2_MELEN